ncbi:MAG TPA: FixH family protein [Gemmatimonadales bacterium]|nr:FixH family protein [Gemmatimonadales bacterium]
MATPTSRSSHHWPWGIAIGLFIVIVVNAVFAYVAISGEDAVVPSYATGSR